MKDFEIDESLVILHCEIHDGDIYQVQLYDEFTDEVLQEISMSRDIALRMAYDIIERLE